MDSPRIELERPTEPHDRPAAVRGSTLTVVRRGAWSLRSRAVKGPRPCPLVLPVKVGSRPNIVLGSEES